MPTIVPSFELLQREQCKASIMLEGLTGKGKSGLAIMLGYGLVGGFDPKVDEKTRTTLWKKIFAADAENRSLNLFMGIPASFGGSFGRFYGAQLTPQDGYAPSNYLLLREAAVQKGAEVFIADSITHMWTAKGGVLDIVNEMKNKNPKLDNYRVWGSDEVSSEKQKLIDVIRDHRCHVITTVRVKEKFEMRYSEDKKGNEVVSIGEQQLQQEGLKFEPDLVLHMLSPGRGGENPKQPLVKVTKSRYAIFAEGDEVEVTPQLCEQLRVYLSEGADPAELLEAQRQDYVNAVKALLDSNSSAKTIWPVLKADAGLKDTKMQDIPLVTLKHLYSQLSGE